MLPQGLRRIDPKYQLPAVKWIQFVGTQSEYVLIGTEINVEVRELEKYSVVLTADVSFSTGGAYVPREEHGVPKTLLVIASPPQGDDVSSWQRKWGPMWNFKPVFGLSIWRSPMDAKEMEREANQASNWKKVRRSFMEQKGVNADGSTFAALPYVKFTHLMQFRD